MLFSYRAKDQRGADITGTIDALNMDVAISALQRRGLVVANVESMESTSILDRGMTFFERVKVKDIVILSRQMATLFQAQVSALRIFRLLGAEVESKPLRRKLAAVADDIQGGSSISTALQKHPDVFSEFYVNMVKVGEESGKLDETFLYLADYLDRTYEITSKAKNAFIYPAFVVFTFVSVMVLMLTFVIPKISVILKESGQDIPIYTKIVLAMSSALTDYGYIVLIVIIAIAIGVWKWTKTPVGALAFDRFRISIPALKNLYRKLYLSRIADNMNTMLSAGIPMIRSLELTGAVVGNRVFRNILEATVEAVKGGSPVSDSMGRFPEIPRIMIQMIKVGEETGELGNILKTLANFYRREVNTAVDTVVDLIEPVMVVGLGLGVGFLLASVLIPIYNISSGGG